MPTLLPVRIHILFWCAGLLGALLTPVHACFSGLDFIPTTDLVSRGDYSLNLQVEGPASLLRADTRFLNTQFGLTDRWEAGVDFDLDSGADSEVFLNAKYLLSKSRDEKDAVAVGITNVAHLEKTSPYLVYTHAFQGFRGHLGDMVISGSHHPFVGADTPVNPRVKLMAECTQGANNFAIASVDYTLTSRMDILLGAKFPNAGGAMQYSLIFTVCGPWQAHPKAQ